MKGITWARDSHGLFDYESRHLQKNSMKTNNQCSLRRVNNDIEIQPYDPRPVQPPVVEGSDIRYLLNIVNEDGKNN